MKTLGFKKFTYIMREVMKELSSGLLKIALFIHRYILCICYLPVTWYNDKIYIALVPVSGTELQNVWNFLCERSVFCILMRQLKGGQAYIPLGWGWSSEESTL
jgi:hypothetical protein